MDDHNRIVGQALAALIKASFSDVKSSAVTQFEKFALDLRFGVEEYFRKMDEKYSIVKTLIYKDKPVKLEEVYINLRLKCSNEEISDKSLIYAPRRSRSVVVGTGGTGKSMIMRYLFLKSVDLHDGKIPIFVELRNLVTPDGKLIPLFEYSREAIQVRGAATPLDVFRHGLEKGFYSLFLDGFDEIDPDHRGLVEQEILGLADKYPGCPIILSGRPDDRFSSWTEFCVYRVQPLNIQELTSLIGKLNYESDVKEKFLSAVGERLWATHEEFLCVPLLATMMLMTFEEFADIPTKIHVFYHQAFLTLFSRHDASKSQFRRKTFTGLSVDVFERAFSAFCFITYYNGDIDFSDVTLRTYARRALDTERLDVEVENFIKDLEESVCIIQKDGLKYVFVHRTFQEYFAALFINANQQIDIFQVLRKIAMRGEAERCIPVLYDMSPSVVNGRWAIEEIGGLLESVKDIDPDVDITGYIKITGRRLMILKTFVAAIPDGHPVPFWCLPILKSVYGGDDTGDLVFVNISKKILRDWYNDFHGKSPSGRSKAMTREGRNELLSDGSKANRWLNLAGLGKTFGGEVEWLRSLRAELVESVTARQADLDEILQIGG